MKKINRTHNIKKINRIHNMTDQEKAEMIYLYERGAIVREIAKYYGRDPATIFRLLLKTNAKRKTFDDFLEEMKSLSKNKG